MVVFPALDNVSHCAVRFLSPQIGIDDALLSLSSTEQIIEMNNGCVCCTVRGDLVRTALRCSSPDAIPALRVLVCGRKTLTFRLHLLHARRSAS